MNRYTYSEIEVVGFDGAVVAECGDALPILRAKENGLVFRPSQKDFDASGVTAAATYDAKEIDAYRAEGRITLLEQPLSINSAVHVVYVAHLLVQEVSVDLCSEADFRWTPLRADADQKVWIGCASEPRVSEFLNKCGRKLMAKATGVLATFLANRERHLCEESERLCKWALSAARDQSLRARIWLRYGIALGCSERKETLLRMFRPFIQQEFPYWGWKVYIDDVKRLKDVISIESGISTKPIPQSNAFGSLTDELQNARAQIASIPSEDERTDAAKRVAAAYAKKFGITHEDIERFFEKVKDHASLGLDEKQLRILLSDPQVLVCNHVDLIKANVLNVFVFAKNLRGSGVKSRNPLALPQAPQSRERF